MNRTLSILLFCSIHFSSWAQDGCVITGRITDSISGDPLIGASIVSGRQKGTVSDASGNYLVRITGEQVKTVTLTFHYLGYVSVSRSVKAVSDDTVFLDVKLGRSVMALDEIVISAGKYEQKLSDVMVSVDIIKPDRIANTSTTNLETVLRQTPGVEILDGQPGIRGGAGYSYGAGSRVLVLMDDLPILTGDVGDVKWDYLPVENIQQVEVIKGASSVLYGSSALNGIFNIRSRYPVDDPKTGLSLYSGVYLDPAREETVWWDRPRLFAGFDFSHRRKIRNLDLVLGGNLFRDEGYRTDEYDDRARMNIGIRHRNRKVGGLTYGINLNGMLTDKSDFLLWRDSRSGALIQNPLAVSALTGNRFNLDPFVEFRGRKGDQHTLKSRFFHIGNTFPETPDKNNRSSQLYGEYRYHTNLAGRVLATAGISGTWTTANAALYGDHMSMNQAVFIQGDGKLFAGLTASLGLRFERYVLNEEVEYSTPVFRAGLNYQLFDHTYLRASFGQGYRFPSVAEKFTATNVGMVKIFPNPDLVSETGWSSEIGIKQGFKMGNFQGYLDLAAFLTEYSNMIEFLFDIYQVDSLAPPGLDDYGFMAQNVGNARITGAELTIYGSGGIGNFPFSLMAGYTWLHPVDLDAADTTGEGNTLYLKYRYRHSLKADAEISYSRFSLGFTLVVNSRMERIDDVFLDPFFGDFILPGFPDYWKEKNRGYAVLDARVLCNITPYLRVGLILKNALNREFMGRPGDIQPPRNITLRLTADF
jgi:iron complex outermembrane receptor protein